VKLADTACLISGGRASNISVGISSTWLGPLKWSCLSLDAREDMFFESYSDFDSVKSPV
jgi:hypothetical protein